MARNRPRRSVSVPDTRKPVVTTDSFQNVAARLGIGTDNLNSSATYGLNPLSRNRQQLEFAYRGSWLVGIGVDAIADDMTRAGITIQSDMPPEDLENIYAAFPQMDLWGAIADTIRWARLYGGSIGVMLIDGQDMSTPMRVETVGRDQFKGICVLDRWQVQPDLSALVTEFGPSLGLPSSYKVVVGSSGLQGQVIHHSRCIRFEGVRLPHWQRQAESLWGQSVVERLYDRMVAFDSATTGAAQLVHKAHLRTYSVDKLRELIATGGRSLDALVKQIEFIRAYQSSEGLTLIDSTDKFEVHQYGFSGLAELIGQLAEQISGALQTPLVRLMGQSPAGFSNGDGDLHTYHEGINSKQETGLRRPITVLLDVLHRSRLGRPPPPGMGFSFNPLRGMSDQDRADLATKVSTAVTLVYDSGIIDRATALKELRQASRVSGVWSNVTDEDIAAAEADPPEFGEALAPDATAQPEITETTE